MTSKSVLDCVFSAVCVWCTVLVRRTLGFKSLQSSHQPSRRHLQLRQRQTDADEWVRRWRRLLMLVMMLTHAAGFTVTGCGPAPWLQRLLPTRGVMMYTVRQRALPSTCIPTCALGLPRTAQSSCILGGRAGLEKPRFFRKSF